MSDVAIPRVATAADASTITELLVGAFYDDPTWGWAFPDPQARRRQHRKWWRIYVDGALRYPWVWLAAKATATSVWIPPGGTEMTKDQEYVAESLLKEQLGPGAARVIAALELFEAAHPREEPHYYLSLLATDCEHRGHGYGLKLLADNLRRIDTEGFSAYLEASNVANVPLYERYGFRVVGYFDLPEDGPRVTTMWRSPRHSAETPNGG